MPPNEPGGRSRLVLAVSRSAAAALVCTAALAAQQPPPLSPVQSRILATSALLFEREGLRHDLISGVEPGENGRQRLQHYLSGNWGVTNHQELINVLEALKKIGYRERYRALAALSEAELHDRIAAAPGEERYPLELVLKTHARHGRSALLAWDLVRYVAVCRWGYGLGYLTDEEFWSRVTAAAQDLQRSFRSWQEMGDDYLLGREFWGSSGATDMANAWSDWAYRALLTNPWSPWRKLEWGMDIGRGPVPESRETNATLILYPRPGGLTCFSVDVRNRPDLDLKPAMAEMLACQVRLIYENSQNGDYHLAGDCVRPEFAVRAQLRASFPIPRLAAALQPLDVTKLFIEVQHSLGGPSELRPPGRFSWVAGGIEYQMLTMDLDEAAQDLHVTYGYTPADFHRLAAMAATFAAAVLVLVFLHNAAVRAAASGSRSAADDLFLKWRGTLSALLWVGWTALVCAAGALPMIRLWARGEGFLPSIPAIALLGLPPLIVEILSTLMTAPTSRLLQGSDSGYREAFWTGLWCGLTRVPPFAAVLVARDPQRDPNLANVLFLLPLLLLLETLAMRRCLRALGYAGAEVLGGSLKTRVFDLAHAAGAPIRKLVMLRPQPSKSFASFVSAKGYLTLAPELLEHLDRREIEALVSFELTRFRLGHPRRMIWIGCAGLLLSIVYLYWLPGDSGWPVLKCLEVIQWLCIWNHRSLIRRADALAWKLTGDAQAMISMLRKVDQLRVLSFGSQRETDRWCGPISIESRVRAIASQAGIAPEEAERNQPRAATRGERWEAGTLREGPLILPV